jgi:hypothetical protein
MAMDMAMAHFLWHESDSSISFSVLAYRTAHCLDQIDFRNGAKSAAVREKDYTASGSKAWRQ